MSAYVAWLILIAGMTLAGLVAIGCAFVFDTIRGWWKDRT